MKKTPGRGNNGVTAQPLTTTQKKYLLRLAHRLHPVVIVGKKGVFASLLEEIDAALEHHELIKIKLAVGNRTERLQLVHEIAHKTDSDLIQFIGRTASLYRRSNRPQIHLSHS